MSTGKEENKPPRNIENFQAIIEKMPPGIHRLTYLNGTEIVRCSDEKKGEDRYYLVMKNQLLGRGGYGQVFAAYPISMDEGSFGQVEIAKPYVLKEFDLLKPLERAALLALRIKAGEDDDANLKEFTRLIDLHNKKKKPEIYPREQVIGYIDEQYTNFLKISGGLTDKIPAKQTKITQEQTLANLFYHTETPIFFEDHTSYHLMERVPGSTLKNTDLYGLTFLQRVNLAVQAATELEGFHAGQLLHFDLKPANTMIGTAADPRVDGKLPQKKSPNPSTETPSVEEKTPSPTRKPIALNYSQYRTIDFGLAIDREHDKNFNQKSPIPVSLNTREGKTYRAPEAFKYDKKGKAYPGPQEAGPKTDVYMLEANVRKIFSGLDTNVYPVIPDFDVETTLNNFLSTMRANDYDKRPDSATVTRFFTTLHHVTITQDYLNILKEKQKSWQDRSWIDQFRHRKDKPTDADKQLIIETQKDIDIDLLKLRLIRQGLWNSRVFSGVLDDQISRPDSYDFSGNCEVCKALSGLSKAGLLTKDSAHNVLNALSYAQNSAAEKTRKIRKCQEISKLCDKRPLPESKLHALLDSLDKPTPVVSLRKIPNSYGAMLSQPLLTKQSISISVKKTTPVSTAEVVLLSAWMELKSAYEQKGEKGFSDIVDKKYAGKTAELLKFSEKLSGVEELSALLSRPKSPLTSKPPRPAPSSSSAEESSTSPYSYSRFQ